jgi:hypothetical protein
MTGVSAFAWYRFRATWSQRWSGYVTIVVLIALLGGLSMAAVAGARRTQSSFTTFLASTNPSQLRFGTAAYNPALDENSGYDPATIRLLEHLAHVRKVESAVLLNAVPYLVDGQPSPNGEPNANEPMGLNAIGSVNGLYFDVDRATVTEGRMANPAKVDQAVFQASQSSGLHIGQKIAFGIYSNAQESKPGFSAGDAPYRRVVITVVGFAHSNDSVVADTVDDSGSFLILFTPAFTKQFLNCCAKATPDTAIQVARGAGNVAKVVREISAKWPKAAGVPSFYVTSVTEAKAEKAIKPESIALGLFGLIAALSVLLIAGQTIGRQLRRGALDQPALRAVGTNTLMRASEGLIGVGASVILGALLAVGVAVLLSPIAPIGIVRPVYPHLGFAWDWTVLGLGFLFLVVVLGSVALVTAYRLTRSAGSRSRSAPRSAPVAVRKAAAWGFPPPAVVGLGFALNSRASRNTVPVRSAILGVALALTVATTTLAFGASLHTLVSRPALYGWNWNYELIASGGTGDIPQQQVTTLLDSDHDVSAWSGVYFSTLDIDGLLVPVLGAQPGASVTPPLLDGHAFDQSNQVVLGSQTLTQLHKHVGDSVTVRRPGLAPVHLRIVGTAVMPAIGTNYSQHLEMGTGALLSYKLISAFNRNELGAPHVGPNAILVRLRPGASASSLGKIAVTTSRDAGSGVNVQGVERPAEILNYRSMGTAPALLALALAIGAVLAFALTLISSVQRRRRELALLKTLGFTRRQLAAVIAWQASIDVALGAFLGVVVGVLAGRWLWIVFARNIGVVAQPTVPVIPLVILVISSLALANIVAFIPGVIASRTRAALLLRAD